jgi:hypothetical protein
LWATTGDCWTPCYGRPTKEHFIEFLRWMAAQIPAGKRRISAILDNLDMHQCHDRLRFQIPHPRWEFVYQPKSAADVNLIEPWWTVLRSVALKGRRVETWDEIGSAVTEATAYWNAHQPPFVWGRRWRHPPLRPARSVSFTTKMLRFWRIYHLGGASEIRKHPL